MYVNAYILHLLHIIVFIVEIDKDMIEIEIFRYKFVFFSLVILYMIDLWDV